MWNSWIVPSKMGRYETMDLVFCVGFFFFFTEEAEEDDGSLMHPVLNKKRRSGRTMFWSPSKRLQPTDDNTAMGGSSSALMEHVFYSSHSRLNLAIVFESLYGQASPFRGKKKKKIKMIKKKKKKRGTQTAGEGRCITRSDFATSTGRSFVSAASRSAVEFQSALSCFWLLLLLLLFLITVWVG